MKRLALNERKGAANSGASPANRISENPRTGLVTAAQLSTLVGVNRGFVYEHADDLGAYRLGHGPKARLRFSVDEALAGLRRLSPCVGTRTSAENKTRMAERKPRRQVRSSEGATVQLLPIRPRPRAN